MVGPGTVVPAGSIVISDDPRAALGREYVAEPYGLCDHHLYYLATAQALDLEQRGGSFSWLLNTDLGDWRGKRSITGIAEPQRRLAMVENHS